MENRTIKFDTRDEDTCMQSWTFSLSERHGSPIIDQLEIARTSQGCPGHPKTISALVKDRTLDSIDLNGLAETDCHRSLSCGQMLRECITKLKKVK